MPCLSERFSLFPLDSRTASTGGSVSPSLLKSWGFRVEGVTRVQDAEHVKSAVSPAFIKGS